MNSTESRLAKLQLTKHSNIESEQKRTGQTLEKRLEAAKVVPAKRVPAANDKKQNNSTSETKRMDTAGDERKKAVNGHSAMSHEVERMRCVPPMATCGQLVEKKLAYSVVVRRNVRTRRVRTIT